MNTYNFDVNYTKGVVYGPNILLVSNDHNSTIFKFNFDQTGRHVFKLLYPDGTCYVQDIIDNQLILTKGILNQEGNYQFEVSLYKDDSRLTTARIKEFPVRLELVDTDSVVQPDDRVPILDNLIEETNKVVEAAKKGEFDGATFTPNVSENGDLSWTNDKGKENPPTVNIKGEPGEPGEPGAVKMQVVDTLPEVGETDTIYLLKKDTPGDDNYYDEYVYTTNNGWEHIGDTSVDLTDYYTKEETDNKLYNKQDKINRFYVVDCKNTLGDSFDEINNIYDTDILNQLTNIMNECYTNGYKSIAILFSGKNSFIAYTRHGSDFSTQRYNYYLYGYLNLEDTYDTARIYTKIVRTEINGTWNNNVFTTNGLFLKFGSSFIVPDTSQVLTKTNTTSYTPTGNYNPATKKYVDDNKYTLPIASASTLGGIKIGENLTIDENGVLSTSGGTEVLPIYNVECDISNGPSPNWYDSNSNFAVLTKKAINEAYNKGDLHFILNYGSSSNDNGTTLQVVVKIYDTNRPISFNTIPEISYMGGTYKEQLISLNYAKWVYTDGEWTYPTGSVGAQFISDVPFMTDSSARSTFLSKTNTKSYTPTSDYNPATKKYVDDGLKSINNGIPTIMTTSSFDTNITDEATLNELSNLFTEYYNNHNQSFNGLCFNLITTVDGITGSRLANFYSLGNMNSSAGPCFITTSWSKNGSAIQYADISYSTVVVPVNISNNIVTVSAFNPSLTYSNELLSNRTLTKNNTKSFTPTANYHPATKKYVDDNIKIYNISIQSPSDFLISNTDLKTKLESILKQYAAFGNNPGFALLFSYTLTKEGELYYPASVNTGTVNTILFRSIKASEPQNKLPERRLINPFTVSQIEVEYTDTYTINKIKHNSRTYNLIAWDNQQEITPLGDYNVATKKYVDDTITTAITTSLEGSY